MDQVLTGLKALDATNRALERLCALVSALGTALILVVMGLIVAEVIMRRLFAAPIPGVVEMVSLSILAIVFLQLGHTAARGRLIRSEAFLTALRRRLPRLADFVDAALNLAGAWMIWNLLTAFWPIFQRSWLRGDMVGTVGQFLAPIWPVHGVVLFGAALMLAVFLLRAMTSALHALRGATR